MSIGLPLLLQKNSDHCYQSSSPQSKSMYFNSLLFILLTCSMISTTHQKKTGGKEELNDGWCLFYGPPECKCRDNDGGDLQLNCSARNLTTVPELNEDSKWNSIDLRRNPLRKLNKYEFARTTITNLDLSHCQLSSLHRNTFALSRGIEYLSLAHNQLEHIPSETGSHLLMLKTLDLSYNPLAKLDFSLILSQCNLLDMLILNGLSNLSRQLDLSASSTLRSLSINNMSLTKLPVERMRLPASLRVISATDNAISELGGTNELANIAKLNLSRNKFENFPDNFKSSSLLVLDLSANKIANLRGFAFSKLPNLTRVYISDNGLAKIEENFLCSAGENLTLIDLSNNSVRTFPLCALSVHNVSSGETAKMLLEGNNITCDCSLVGLNITASHWSLVPSSCRFNESFVSSMVDGPCPEAGRNCSSTCKVNREKSEGRSNGKSAKSGAAADVTSSFKLLLLLLVVVLAASMH